MREYAGLCPNGIINLRMAMPQRQAPYPRFQIKIFVSLKVIKVTAFTLDNIRQHQRMFITPEYMFQRV
jgi:hypothetical protein